MSRVVSVVILLGSTLGLSCSSPTILERLRAEPAHAHGTITEYDSGAGSTFLLEERPDMDTGEKFIVRMDSMTEVFRMTDAGDTIQGGIRDIMLRSVAAVWFEGPVMESYPAQGVARYVLLDAPMPD